MTDSNLQNDVIALVRDLRNHRSVETNWPAFRELVETHLPELLRTVSTRWLISICDTYVDFGEPLRARHAMSISFFVNMLRLAETVKYVRPDVSAERLAEARGALIPLYDEVCTFSIDKQDVFLNLTRRFNALLCDDPVMEAIWREILKRLHAGNNVITEMAHGSPVEARYFPLDPRGLTDNYGR
ncbi:unannotated protein [freshwater metagenome]|uniref:Unannotated protein n=1 Tax=freshwater metagenome TaxID=449393 RepID=A0A6J6Z706_9ZZZZ